MGSCVSAHEAEDEKLSNIKRKLERRRLSVTPQHVGSIDKADARPGLKAPDGMSSVDPTIVISSEDNGDQKVEAAGAGRIDNSRFKYAICTKKGFVPYNNAKKNQDSYLVVPMLHGDEDISLYGAFDGHGEFGHLVSGFVKEELPKCFESEPNLKSDTKNAIMDASRQLVKLLTKRNKINCQFSGTTAVFSVRVGNMLYTANIGDSRCCLCSRDAATGGVKAVPLTIDHKPELPAERERILKSGGRVEPLPAITGQPDEDRGPNRVWLMDVNLPGLAMSRSIGDKVSHQVGVIDIPEVSEHQIAEADVFAIWATDGVWEFMSNQEVCELVYSMAPNWQKAAVELCAEATRRWVEEEEVIDDITCCIVSFIG